MNGDEMAFPCGIEGCEMGHSGLTKRELFAALAMQGMTCDLSVDHVLDIYGVAANAVEFADALIAELQKSKR